MTKQEARNVLTNTPYLRKPNGDADTEYANAIDIALECIEKCEKYEEICDVDEIDEVIEMLNTVG